MQGKILGERFEIIAMSGEGGMSTVYRAKDLSLDRVVAVKILKEEFKNDQNFIQRFKTEAMAAARLSHSNIVNVYDVGQDGDDYYIVMEFIEGRTLADVIAENGRLEQRQACDIAVMICDGVQHAHERGVIHRDIKPHNIMITADGLVKVADFGIARAVSAATITYGNSIVGSVHYISPEQAKGQATDATADIYSIGCVLYEMLTGKVPFNAESPVTVALKHIHDEAIEPHLLNNSITPAVEAVVLKAMEKQPQDRFASAVMMRNALMKAQGHTPPKDHPVAPPAVRVGVETADPVAEGAEGMAGARKKKKKKKNSLAVTLILLGILGLLIGVALSLFGNDSGGIFGKEVAVPDLIDKDVKAAKAELDKLGLIMVDGGEAYSEEIEAGRIMKQDPQKERIVKPGREVSVTISKGSEMVEVPDLTGKDTGTAEVLLKSEGLSLGEVDEAFHDSVESGLIIQQRPVGGRDAAPGSAVNVTVSKGKKPEPVETPNLVGKTVDAATIELQDLGLRIGTIKREGSNTHYEGIIFRQSVEAGTMLEENNSINVLVSTGPGPAASSGTIDFVLPRAQDSYEVVVVITDGRGTRSDNHGTFAGGERIVLGINYFGSGAAEVILDGESFKTFEL